MPTTPKQHPAHPASSQVDPVAAADSTPPDAIPDDIILPLATPAGTALEASGNSGVGVKNVTASGNQGIDGLLSGVAWSSTNLTYSFPTDPADYGPQSDYGSGPYAGFSVVNAAQQADIKRALSMIASYTKLTFTQITETTTTHATIRYANSSSPATSFTYYPSTGVQGGDVFFGGTGQNPQIGNFDSGQAVLHETGHALGLKHGQDAGTFGMVPANELDIEYSVMNYPNYIGSTEGYGTAAESEQTYMMYDIASLQYIYGENLGNLGATFVYTWSPTTGEEFINGVSQGVPFNNHIFDTVWTGGATATYDLHVYNSSAVLDLRPGKPIDFSPAQLADLGAYGTPGPGQVLAQGDIYNALLYNNQTNTEISGLITGNGDDTVYENDLLDTIRLGSGNDIVYAGLGGASITGGGGSDTLVEAGTKASYTITKLNNIVTVADSQSARSGVEMLSGIRTIQFSDGSLDTTTLACFLRGTAIATGTGERAVEALRVGDIVRTHDGSLSPIVWIGKGRTRITTRNRCQIMPVIVRASALGPGVPRRDLHITRDHALLVPGIEGHVLVQAEHLVNDASIVWNTAADTIEYYHIELAAHAVLLAEGAPAESFRDANSRHLFDAARGSAHAVSALAAPLVSFGPELEAAWRAVAARAEHPVDHALTADADLHILADGRRVDRQATDGSTARFVLPAGAKTVLLASRSCIPAALGLGSDRRRLGVAISRIVARCGDTVTDHAADAPTLVEGFHASEGTHRWTAGAACLPVETSNAPVTLDIHIAASLRYRRASHAGVFAGVNV